MFGTAVFFLQIFVCFCYLLELIYNYYFLIIGVTNMFIQWKSLPAITLCRLFGIFGLLACSHLPLSADVVPESTPPKSSSSSSTTVAQNLIARLIPDQSASFICESIADDQGKDVYEMESRDNKIILRGNSAVAMASALYHYLKEFCHCHVSWNGDQLNLPAVLPNIPNKIRISAVVEIKLAYNYVTHGYTMVWWDWKDWERELDWLALHGLNMALIITGQEAVWQNTFTRFGYSNEEMRQWISSPAHQPWQFMQNLEGILPPPQSVIDKRVELGKKIVQRCRELGIRPVLQGFYGMIPSGFAKKFPDAKIVGQGQWAAGLRRPDMLHIQDPRFVPIAKAFLEEQKKLFGDCQYFAADPFHEGGHSGNMNRGEVYKVIQNAILGFDPKAILVKQCWQTSNSDMFAAGDKTRSLALDLWCDYKPFWKNCKGYEGTPWLWCVVQDFGGNLGMEANLARLAKDFSEVLQSPLRGKLSGMAFVPEGTQQNPVFYELFTEMGWRGAPADMGTWIETYIKARYGQHNLQASQAWQLMLQTNYAVSSGESPVNSVIPAAPRIDSNIRGRTWSPGTIPSYDNIKFTQAWAQMLTAAPDLKTSEAFRFDLADITRQALCNYSRPLYDQLISSFQKRNLENFKTTSQAFLQLIRDLDHLTATRTDWLMGKWVAQARRWGESAEDKAYLDRCARMLLTTWVPSPNTNLSDYANREWNGLLGQYYLPRWELFVKALTDDLEGKVPYSPQSTSDLRAKFELAWISSGSELSSTPQGDTLSVSSALHQKYAPLIAESVGKPGRLSSGAWSSSELAQAKNFIWEVSDKINSPGVYALTFSYSSGQSALKIEAVSLVINDELICTDDHPGSTGWKHSHNSYYLKAISVPPNAKVEIKISGMTGLSGNDSAGKITVEKLK